MAHDFAVRLALIAFATAAIRGLVTGADFQPAVKTALAALALFYLLGYLCGEVARRLIEEHVQLEAAREKAGNEPPSRQERQE